MIYLQQLLSQSGIASRRRATELIKSGKIKINDKIAQAGQKIDPQKDKVKLNNKLIKPQIKRIYYLVNKPVGYACTTRDSHSVKKVVDLVPAKSKVWPVGRLDKDSSGLIILTNDGELTHRLTHPSFLHEKEYLVTFDKTVKASLLSKLIKGVKLREGLAKVDKLKKINDTKLSLTIHQGWNRQIRRMFKQCGYQVIGLERIRIGKIKLGNLRPGQYIKLSNL